MKKTAAAGSVLATAALGVLGTMGAAHAADGDSATVSPPNVSPNQSTVSSNHARTSAVSNESAALPNTGGPNEMLLGGAVALLLAGGATVVVARRRQTD
jgi:LPXTG-motif cell wall-anchored protein